MTLSQGSIDMPNQRVNWPWVLGCGVSGAILIVAAFLLEHFLDWQGVSLETMTSGGIAFLLAGVLFFLERLFLKDVGDAAATAAVAATDARIVEYEEQVNIRLDQLDDRMNDLLEARRKRQDEIIQALDDPTAQSVANALAAANRLGAIAFGHVTVQSSRDFDEVGLEFSWGVEVGDGRFGERRQSVLMIRAHIYSDERSGGRTPAIEVTWQMDESAEQIGLRLREQFELRGRWQSDDTLDWPLSLRKLKRSLDIAIRSRRRDGSSGTIQGALFEFVTDEWAITDAGLECPSQIYVLGESEFPERYSMKDSRIKRLAQFRPDKPQWVDATLWDELLRRGGKHFPINRGRLSSSQVGFHRKRDRQAIDPPDTPSIFQGQHVYGHYEFRISGGSRIGLTALSMSLVGLWLQSTVLPRLSIFETLFCKFNTSERVAFSQR